ncbi:MAG TPA: Thivi_2564 family membrane protein [Polyangia bacterium]|jgi:hypothetical protein|nr:Thivi_2564 family membrane protein [Polyangia bacterium]
MSILGLFCLIIVVGVLLWAVNRFLPMAPPIKTLLNIVAVVALVFVILYTFGVFGYLEQFRTPVPRLRR